MVSKAIVEVHRLLGACQVVLICDENILQRSFQVSVFCDSINLSRNDEVLSSVKFKEIMLKSQSISGLTVNENSISFRVQIESENNLKLDVNRGVTYIPKFEKDINFNIICRCCENVICKDVHFKRILPLPSIDDWNYDDWFCHKHSHHQNSGSKDCDKNEVTIVSRTDCLYGNYYIHINVDYLLSKKLGVIHCDKCLSWLGKKTKYYARLWNSSLKFCDDDNLKMSPLNDFINVVLNRINNSVSPVNKLITMCSLTNNSVHYLLLWIMDKNLTALTNHNNIRNDKKTVNLSEIKVVKVTYNYFTIKNDIIQSWLDDPLIEAVEVSKSMIHAGSESLIKSTEMIAKPYRFLGDMHLGYLHSF